MYFNSCCYTVLTENHQMIVSGNSCVCVIYYHICPGPVFLDYCEKILISHIPYFSSNRPPTCKKSQIFAVDLKGTILSLELDNLLKYSFTSKGPVFCLWRHYSMVISNFSLNPGADNCSLTWGVGRVPECLFIHSCLAKAHDSLIHTMELCMHMQTTAICNCFS